MMHPYKVFLFFLFATAITALFGVGVALPTGDLAMSMLSLGVTSVVTALCALAGGMGVTISTRATFSLMQTGRLIQWPAFMGWALDFVLHPGRRSDCHQWLFGLCRDFRSGLWLGLFPQGNPLEGSHLAAGQDAQALSAK